MTQSKSNIRQDFKLIKDLQKKLERNLTKPLLLGLDDFQRPDALVRAMTVKTLKNSLNSQNNG